MGWKKKNQDVQLSKDAANQMLSNIFEACDYEANRVPLEVLESYSHYRRERHLLQKAIIILLVVLFLMLPVLFITAKVEVDWVPDTPAGSPIIQITTRSLIPVERITATMEGYSLDVYQMSEGIYQILPNRNGTLVVTVTLASKQFTEHTVEVTNVDVTPPTLLSSELTDGELEIFFEDESGELDYNNIYAVDENGNTVYPLRYDRVKMSVTFAYPDSYLNIFVPDRCKNTLQLVLSVQ